MKAGGESKNVKALRPSPPSPGRKNRKKYTNHARSMGVYVASPSRDEWRFDAVEDGDHLSKKAHLWKTASAGKAMTRKLLSIDIWKPASSAESLAVGRTKGKATGARELQNVPSTRNKLSTNTSQNKSKSVRRESTSPLEESIMALRRKLPAEVLNHASPFTEILRGEHYEETKHAFYEKPRKRNDTDLRYITLWLLNTPMTKDLPLLIRVKLAKVIQMSKYFPASMVLATETNRHTILESGEIPTPPPMISIVFHGNVKQKSKATGDERILGIHSSFCELQALGDEYAEDTAGIFAGQRGVDLAQIPLKDYKLLVRPYRLRELNTKVEALRRSPLFAGLSKGRLGRIALGAKTILFRHREMAMTQGQKLDHVYIVSKGSFVSGRTVSLKQRNIWPEKKKGNEGQILKNDIVKYVRVSKSQPCVTVARHGLGEFFGEEGNISLSNKKVLVNLLLQNLNGGDRTGDQERDKGGGGGYLKSPEQVSLEKWVDAFIQSKNGNTTGAWASVASEGASEVICLNAEDFKLLLPDDRFKAFEILRHRISNRPLDHALRKRAEVRKLIQNIKHSILRR